MSTARKFVIQKHRRENQPVHWDLMFEASNTLQTYRLEFPPDRISPQGVGAVRIFDHPVKFLTYQGTVNNGRGWVDIADQGTYQVLTESENRRELLIEGNILKGKFTLELIRDNNWQLLPS